MPGDVEVSHYRKLPQYIAALSATGGALAMGTVIGWTSPTQLEIVSGGYGFSMTPEGFSWVGSTVNIGAAIACIPTGLLCNLVGRKIAMLTMVVPFLLGWALLIWSKCLAVMIAGRFFLGLAGGAFCVAAPMYTGEIASKEIRGILGSFFQLMMTIGILFTYAVGFVVDTFTLNVICGSIPIVFGAVFLFMPESPAYLVHKDEPDRAAASIRWLRGGQYDAHSELTQLKADEEQSRKVETSLMTAFRRSASIRAMCIALGLMFFQQMSGANAVLFYTTSIFMDANTGIDPDIATILIGTMQVVATLVAAIIVDRLGRRALLLASGTLMALCTGVLGAYFYVKEQGVDVANIGWVPIMSLCVFIIMFSLGFGPVPWLMMSELFARDIKGMASAISGTFNWMLSFMITKTFGNLQSAIGPGPTFWLFSGVTLAGIIFVFVCVPETKGKSLAEIQALLGDRGSAVPPSQTDESDSQDEGK